MKVKEKYITNNKRLLEKNKTQETWVIIYILNVYVTNIHK